MYWGLIVESTHPLFLFHLHTPPLFNPDPELDTPTYGVALSSVVYVAPCRYVHPVCHAILQYVGSILGSTWVVLSSCGV